MSHLRSHPVRRSNKAASFVNGSCDLSADSEVCQLDISRLRQQDVGPFDVSMDFSSAVQITQTIQSFSAHIRYLGLGERSGD